MRARSLSHLELVVNTVSMEEAVQQQMEQQTDLGMEQPMDAGPDA